MPGQWITTDSLAKYTQIPDSLITKLNSSELLFVCMKWPVFKRILYGNFVVNDFQRLHIQCKALQQLKYRNQVQVLLMVTLQQMNVEQNISAATGNSVEELQSIELILTVPGIFEGMPYGQLKHIAGQVLMKCEAARLQHLVLNNDIAVYLLSQLMHKAGIENQLIETAIEAPVLTDINAVIGLASQWTGYSYTPADLITIYTPNHTAVQVEYWEDDFPPEMIAALNSDWDNFIEMNPDHVYRIGDASRRYNCHGYAWHTFENGLPVVMSVAGVNKYIKDKSYLCVNYESDASKVIYYNNTGLNHSAITTGVSGRYISKWGEWGLYLHDAEYYGPLYQDSTVHLKYYAPTKIYGPDWINLNESTEYYAHRIQGYLYEWRTSQNIIVEEQNENHITIRAINLQYKPFIEVTFKTYEGNVIVKVAVTCKVLFIKERYSLNIFPNPASDNITYEIIDQYSFEENMDESLFSVEVFNQQGNKLLQFNHVSPENAIDIGNLPNGFYYTRFYNGRVVYIKTLQVNH